MIKRTRNKIHKQEQIGIELGRLEMEIIKEGIKEELGKFEIKRLEIKGKILKQSEKSSKKNYIRNKNIRTRIKKARNERNNRNNNRKAIRTT